MMQTMKWLAAAGLLLWSTASSAVLTIEITRGANTGQPIAIVPFGFERAAGSKTADSPQALGDVIAGDLGRSGRFQVLPRKDYVSQPHDDKDVVYKDWRIIKAEALVIGSVRAVAGNKYEVRFRLYDVFKESQLIGFQFPPVGPQLLRTVAHQISDMVYEKLTGERGAFNTRIAYITHEHSTHGVFKLQVADSDGANPITIVKSTEPLMSPSWSPDGTRLAYVSFEDRRSKVYQQVVASGRRELLAEFRGINGAPAWSPDGKQLALALSKDGNAEIYVLTLATHELRRLTYDPAIDTEPSWSPDGRRIVFTSDRSGRPQIYRMSADGGDAERLTFEGDYNACASYAPDGKSLTLVNGDRNQFRIATLQLDGLSLQVLTDTTLDESPSFAPNGSMILYATEQRGRGVLASVSVDGRTRQVYKEQGDVREPAWSPYNRELEQAPEGPKE